MFTRRTILGYSAAALAMGSLPLRAAAPLSETARQALGDSDLVYINPLKADASESRCHAEVWYVFDGTNVFVVTSSTAWRARALQRGWNRARMWVGEFGNWEDADEAYRNAPELLATGSLVSDAALQSSVLDRFGAKYRLEWVVWGPKFRNGIADGSRVMLLYAPIA
jgi:hypothetical protein